MRFRSANEHRATSVHKTFQEDKYGFSTPPSAGHMAQLKSNSTKFAISGLNSVDWESRD